MLKKSLKRVTVKIGTRVLTDKSNQIAHNVIKNIARQIADIKDKGIEVILVSSGAVGSGRGLLGLDKRTLSLSEMQAAASVGQHHLMNEYNKHLSKRGYVAGQMLLTQEDFTDRKRFLNIGYTLNALLNRGAVPIVNENDSVSTDEIKCGDNDRLSSLVADLADADALIILTDVKGLYDSKGKVIREVKEITDAEMFLCKGKGCSESTGGMQTKLEAIKNAAYAGIECVIADGKKNNVLKDIIYGKKVGTHFKGKKRTLQARKRWIAFSLKAKGKIFVDKGAEKALIEKHKSLLPSGVKKVDGVFLSGAVVEIASLRGKVFARGLSNYSSLEVNKIKSKNSKDIQKELGYKNYDEVVHRDNLVVLGENE